MPDMPAQQGRSALCQRTIELHQMPRQSKHPASATSNPAIGAERMSEARELQLVEAHCDGDADSLGELLQAYQRRVYTICYRMLRNSDEAADLTQDTLVRLVENLHKYDGRAKLSTWIIRIAMNACISYLRKKKVRQTGDLADDTPLQRLNPDGSRSGEQPGSSRVERDELRAALDLAIMSLDPDMRSVLILRDMQGLEYEQLAEALEIPIGTVKSRLFRARAAMRNALEHFGADESIGEAQ